MPGGGYGINVQGLEELKSALKGSAGGLRDLRAAFGYMADTMNRSVHRHLAMSVHYGGSAKDGAGHKTLPKLASTIQSGATINGPWVQAGEGRNDVFLHEFGGSSRWYRGESGTLQTVVIGTSKRGHDITRVRRASRGHVVYTKPRSRNGNFIWNVGFRERSALGEQLHFGLSQVCTMHGLPYEMPGDPALDLNIQTWSW